MQMSLAKPRLPLSRLGPDAMAYGKTPRRGCTVREAETEVKHPQAQAAWGPRSWRSLWREHSLGYPIVDFWVPREDD